MGAWLGLGGDAFAVGPLAHRLDPRVLQAGEVGPGWFGAGGEYDRVGSERVSVGVNSACAGVDGCDLAADTQLDVVLVKPAGSLDR